MKLRKIALLGLALAVLGGGGWWAWSRHNAGKNEVPRFRTVAIDEGAITQVVMANGNLQPVTTVTVGAVMSGNTSTGIPRATTRPHTRSSAEATSTRERWSMDQRMRRFNGAP